MILRYCIECGNRYTKHTNTEYFCSNGHTYYNNPRATVVVALFDKAGKVLVSKRAIEPNKGKYDLPGGFVEYGETVFEAAKREMHEETTLIIDDVAIIGQFTFEYTPNVSVADIIVVTKKCSGTATPQDDVASLSWQDLSFIDSNNFVQQYRNSGLRELLHKYSSRAL